MRLLTVLSIVVCAALLACGETMAIGLELRQIEDVSAVQCPVCARGIRVGHIHQDAAATMMTLMQEGLLSRDVKYTVGREEAKTLNVLVFRFTERQGGNFAADKPASVGYHVHLMDGNVPVRVFVFDQTQEALLDNLFNFFTSIKRGFRWVTAPELANEGVNQALDLFLEDIR